VLVVVLAVDHAKAQDGRASGKVRLLDVQILPLRPVNVPGCPQRGLLGQGHGIGLNATVERLVRPVHIDAGQRDQPDAGWQRRKRGPGVGPVRRRHVDRRVSPERGEHGFAAGPLAAVGVQVLRAVQVGRLGDPAVGHQHGMARRCQRLGDRTADEPGPAQHDHAHRCPWPSAWADSA
jgi:hypothetical protein